MKLKAPVIRYREQTSGCQGGGTDGGLGLADANYYIEWINKKVLLNNTGNYIQYPIINHNGKEYEKKCMYN